MPRWDASNKPITANERFPRYSEQVGLAKYRARRREACKDIPEADVEANIKKYWLDVILECAAPLPNLNVCPFCTDKRPHRETVLSLSGGPRQPVPHADCLQRYNIQQRLEGGPLWEHGTVNQR